MPFFDNIIRDSRGPALDSLRIRPGQQVDDQKPDSHEAAQRVEHAPKHEPDGLKVDIASASDRATAQPPLNANKMLDTSTDLPTNELETTIDARRSPDGTPRNETVNGVDAHSSVPLPESPARTKKQIVTAGGHDSIKPTRHTDTEGEPEVSISRVSRDQPVPDSQGLAHTTKPDVHVPLVSNSSPDTSIPSTADSLAAHDEMGEHNTADSSAEYSGPKPLVENRIEKLTLERLDDSGFAVNKNEALTRGAVMSPASEAASILQLDAPVASTAPTPQPQRPSVTIGRLDVVVTSEKPTPQPTPTDPRRPIDSAAVASRRYLRRV